MMKFERKFNKKETFLGKIFNLFLRKEIYAQEVTDISLVGWNVIEQTMDEITFHATISGYYLTNKNILCYFHPEKKIAYCTKL